LKEGGREKNGNVMQGELAQHTLQACM
jgi:hypothetical protein